MTNSQLCENFTKAWEWPKFELEWDSFTVNDEEVNTSEVPDSVQLDNVLFKRNSWPQVKIPSHLKKLNANRLRECSPNALCKTMGSKNTENNFDSKRSLFKSGWDDPKQSKINDVSPKLESNYGQNLTPHWRQWSQKGMWKFHSLMDLPSFEILKKLDRNRP